MQGDQLGQEGSFRGSGESAATVTWQAEQSETCTDGLYRNPVHPSLRQVSTRVQGLGAGTRSLECRSGNGAAVDFEETAFLMKVRKSITGTAIEVKAKCHC